jgi:hypothetical protein
MPAIFKRKFRGRRQSLDNHLLLIVQLIPARKLNAATFWTGNHIVKKETLATASGSDLAEERIERFLDRFYTYHAQAQKLLEASFI